MFKKKRFLFCTIIISILMCGDVFCEDDIQLNGKAAVLIDGMNGRVLYGKNEREKMPMASTTKIMTCIVALENSNPDDIVEVSDYAASMPDVQLNIRSGEKYYIKDMLYSLMLESHNDTAVAIAEKVGGSVEGFAELMNSKAKSIGAFDTNFVTPNGLDAPEHYTTAYDLTQIARYALKNKNFMEIVNTRNYSFSEIEGKRNFTVNNKDAFLDMMDGAVGVKTGFTGKAGYCFVGAVFKDNKKYITAVLASGWPPHKTYKWQDTKKLMQYGLDNYGYKVIFDGREYVSFANVENGVKDSCQVYAEGYENILVSDKDNIDVVYNVDSKIDAPVKKNQVVGSVIININGSKYREYCIKSKEHIELRDFKWEFNVIYKRFLLDFL
ncbi:MAG: D-alanyl-D-alanine carboxypeptidase [Lachnospiraceae bacterium]|nr:D-alanyl-D-alanine carboxypeptidase [Lachnospiraceae bacterium]MDE6254110.1 D-alanyl-D-alanine carboxypeptidase [Lachnospiraceae bacterium]